MVKYLCVCDGGNVRSVALATMLKDKGKDALACGVMANGKHTVSLLCGWADRIFVLHRPIRFKLPVSAQAKVKICEVGEDTYHDALNPVLLEKCREFLKKERL